ncbi:DUF2955 domain-containing protein [Paracoccus sp. (in: a-proteobacteria)]|uniref:DUF2955 domain-containing protein n=1 Tax=Paracoccus sp. TaxID=267 RepID=UPI00321FC982
MPHDANLSGGALERLATRRHGLRIASASAVGFTLALWINDPIPFLLPVFACQLLTAGRRPLSLVQGLVTIALVLVVAQVLVATVSVLTGHPFVLAALLWLLYSACLGLQAEGKGGAAAFIVIVIAIIVPLLGIEQVDLGKPVVAMFAWAAIGGNLLAWGVHAVWPDPAGATPPSPVTAALPPPRRQALISGAILLASVVLCLLDSRLSFALLIPMTVATLLGQADAATTRRAALGLVIVNLFGGIVASFAFVFISSWPNLPALFLVVLLVALMFGGQIATDPKLGKIGAGALTTFLVLLGLSISPLPGSPSELFSTRIAYVLFAIIFTVCLTALFWPHAHGRRAGDNPDLPAM